MITFTCPQCRKHFQVGDELAGKKGKCKSCGAIILVPAPQASVVAAPPQSRQAPPPPPAQSDDDDEYRLQDEPQVPHRPQYTPQPRYAQQPQYAAQPQYVAPPAPPDPGAAARMSVRLKRLQAEALQVQKAFANSGIIRVQSVQGSPPERYVIEYRVRGLVRGAQGPAYQDQHLAEIQLTSEYPRQSPKCRMLTPIFHPNFEPATICVGDHWTAGERLVDLIIRIAEMIAFQAYNIKSPLDGEAAMWADQNRQHLPTDHRDMRPAELG